MRYNRIKLREYTKGDNSMKNSEFTVGSHILVHGNKGIVEGITRCKEYKALLFNRQLCKSEYVLTEEDASDMRNRGYELIPTGRTATYFTVSFDTEEYLNNTSYNHAQYGCLDEFENYGTW